MKKRGHRVLYGTGFGCLIMTILARHDPKLAKYVYLFVWKTLAGLRGKLDTENKDDCHGILIT